nr:hypothetical protein [Paenibacillus agricola]
MLNLQKIADALNVPLSELFVFDKVRITGKSDKDILINQIIDSLIEMKVSDLRKVKLLLNEVFER